MLPRLKLAMVVKLPISLHVNKLFFPIERGAALCLLIMFSPRVTFSDQEHQKKEKTLSCFTCICNLMFMKKDACSIPRSATAQGEDSVCSKNRENIKNVDESPSFEMFVWVKPCFGFCLYILHVVTCSFPCVCL